MTNQFMNKVIRSGCVDTRKYRYIARECMRDFGYRIYRIALSDLDTVAPWELLFVVCYSKNRG